MSELHEYRQERKGFWRDPGGVPTSESLALEAWARAAHDVLVDTAESYHAVIREAALAERVQDDTGIRTTRPHTKWLDKVLTPVAHLCFRSDEPALTALVVDARGWVGERYDDVMRAADQRPSPDPDVRERHAALARLECYRWAGSAPADGGAAASVSRVVRSRAASTGSRSATGTPRAPRAAKAPAAPKRVAATDRPITVCPACYMAIPATGICDNCD